MKRLYVFYDGECGLCRRCREWLSQQPAYVALVFHPFPSEAARRLCPDLPRFQPREQPIVLSDEGAVYAGESRGSSASTPCATIAAGPTNAPPRPCVRWRSGFACSSLTIG